MTRRDRLLTALAISIGAGACASGPSGQLRFANQEPVWAINDREDVPEEPEERRYYRVLYHYDGHVHRRLTRWMEMRAQRRAADVNSMDEVPDSTWFVNRIGVRHLSPDEIRRGPNVTGSPERHLPWRIQSSKVGGVAIGFIIEDARGKKYILKFDPAEFPEVDTGANVVTQRLLWAAGYHVPEDYVVFFRRQDLLLAPDAVVVDPMGNEERMTPSFVERQLARVAVGPEGRIRGLVSQYLDGKPVGGHAGDGVREDDPNDRVAHQERRELRGAYPIFAWLDHTDMKEDNTLDMYVADPGDPRRHYLMHYLVDFGKALGVQGFVNRRRFIGHSYLIDFHDMGLSAMTLGLYQRPWEDREWPGIPGVGLLDSESFDPGEWKPNTPSYFPFHDVDRFDGFWGAKIVMSFDREQIRAAVEQGRFSHARAAAHITRTLVERQRKTARYWFDRVAPLDGFAVEQDPSGWYRLCFDDLLLRHRLGGSPARETRYTARAYDFDGERVRWTRAARGGASGRACVTGLRPGPSHDGYVVVRIDTERPDRRLPGTLLHLAVDPGTRRLRVIGLRRL